MIPNLINTLVGLVLAWATILHPTWVERRFLPLGAFALAILVLALWARRSDPARWFSNVNIALVIALGVLSLLPLATLPNLTFWGGFWAGCLVPTVALWAALYRPAATTHADEAPSHRVGAGAATMNKSAMIAACALAAGCFAGAARAADPAAGKARYETTCVACHGPTGISVAPIYPNLAGQKQEYLVSTLQQFRDGERPNPIMAPMARDLSDTDIANLALYLSALKP